MPGYSPSANVQDFKAALPLVLELVVVRFRGRVERDFK